MRRKGFWSVIAVAILALVGGLTTAQASVISAMPNADLTSNPVTIDFSDPADPSGAHASFSFSGNNDGIGSSLFTQGPTASVKTDGAGLVAASHIAAVPSGFSSDESQFFDGDIVPGYQSFDDFLGVPSSRSEIFLALGLDFSDGLHFGYAKLDGSTLLSYGYETLAGLGIEAGAQGASPGSGSSTPPGGSGSSTPPGGSGSSTPPGGSGSSTPPGGSGSSTPPGGSGSSTPPGPGSLPLPGPDSATLFALSIVLIGFGWFASRRGPSPSNRGFV